MQDIKPQEQPTTPIQPPFPQLSKPLMIADQAAWTTPGTFKWTTIWHPFPRMVLQTLKSTLHLDRARLADSINKHRNDFWNLEKIEVGKYLQVPSPSQRPKGSASLQATRPKGTTSFQASFPSQRSKERRLLVSKRLLVSRC